MAVFSLGFTKWVRAVRCINYCVHGATKGGEKMREKRGAGEAGECVQGGLRASAAEVVQAEGCCDWAWHEMIWDVSGEDRPPSQRDTWGEGIKGCRPHGRPNS